MATVSDVSEAAELRQLISCVRIRQLQLEGEFFYVILQVGSQVSVFRSDLLPPFSQLKQTKRKREDNIKIQQGHVLRRFVLRRFTFTTLVESDRALPTCGASLSQLKRPFSTQCASSSFPVCMCFFFFYFSAVLLS